MIRDHAVFDGENAFITIEVLRDFPGAGEVMALRGSANAADVGDVNAICYATCGGLRSPQRSSLTHHPQASGFLWRK